MQERTLGSQGPRISVVGYGAWEIGGVHYGPNPNEDAVLMAVRGALEAGMNWIDTAEIYGDGVSEILVGRAIKGRRDEALIATKVAPAPYGTGFGPNRIREAARKSLQRMALDHLDLYQLHWFPDEETVPIEETWGAMAELVEEGLVRYIGVSNFGQEAIERCQRIAHMDSLQPEYSMLRREGEELLAWCGRAGVGVIVYGPLAYGLLTGAIDDTTRFSPEDWRSGQLPGVPYYQDLFAPEARGRWLQVVERLKPIAEASGVTMSQLALSWALHQEGVTAAIAGSRNPGHLRENAVAGEITLTSDTLKAIEGALGR
ncbi:MAG: aldo/keto reductase [Actinomycetota bacterium]